MFQSDAIVGLMQPNGASGTSTEFFHNYDSIRWFPLRFIFEIFSKLLELVLKFNRTLVLYVGSGKDLSHIVTKR